MRRRDRTSLTLALITVMALLASACSARLIEGDSFGASAPDVDPAYVVRVVDGDTAHLLIDGRTEKVRFIGVDSPESTRETEPWGAEASDYAKRALTNQRVWVETDVEDRDRYGRLLAYIWLERPGSPDDDEVRDKQFNAHLLLTGNAVTLTIPPNVRYADTFVRCQREARAAGRGLWNGIR